MKTLFVVVLTIAAVTAESTFCTPGAFFKMDCNSCTCSKDGMRAACTDMACPPELKILSLARSERKQVCTPRAQFKDYCNTCACAGDGLSFACTRMACDKNIWNEDGSLRLRAKRSTIEESMEKVCQPGSSFKNYCNHCFCDGDGLSYSCTRMACDPAIWNRDGSLKIRTNAAEESKQVCTPRSQFKKMCNTCACSEDGTTYACTRMACDPEVWNQDGSLKVLARSAEEPKQVCTPRSQFKKMCNTCACSEDGTTYACTRMACDPEVWNQDGSLKVSARSAEVPKQVCTPRSQFKKMCNTCACSEDGTTYACTRMACDPEIWNQDGSLKILARTAEIPKQVCKPRAQFNDYCNTCTCSEDGTTYACTRMACDHNIWNEDGTVKTPQDIQSRQVEEATPKICEPYSFFKNDCNTCICSSDGTMAACTRMMCYSEAIEIKEEPETPVVNEVENSVLSCKPGETFKLDCNTCFCAKNGVASCTMMLCEDDQDHS